MIRTALWSALVLCACDVPAPSTDAGPPDASDQTVDPPVPPSPPDVPRALCPDGWTALRTPERCEPWPAGHRPTCAAGERIVGSVCTAIATDCATVPPEVAGGASYVVAGSTGGDGTLTHPFGTIADAVASGATRVALGEGSYDLPPIVSDTTITGACPTTTTLVVASTASVNDVTLHRLRLTGPGGLAVQHGHSLTLDGVEIAHLMSGVSDDGSLHVTNVALHDSRGFVSHGAQDLTFQDVTIERVYETALLVGIAASVRLTRVLVADMTTAEYDVNTIGLLNVGQVTIDALAIDGAGGNGLNVEVPSADVHRVMVRGVAGIGIGITSQAAAATFVLDQAWISATGMDGVGLASGTFAANDLVVLGVQRLGIASIMATTRIDRVWVDGARGQGINATGGNLTVHDATVLEVGPGVDPATGVTLTGTGGALVAESAASVQVVGARFDDTISYGVGAAQESHVDLTSVEISNVAPLADAMGDLHDGFGAVTILGATMSFHGVSIHDVASAGILSQGRRLDAEDVTIQRVSAANDIDGIGIVAEAEGPGEMGLPVMLARVRVDDVVRWGILLSGDGTTLEASDVAIARVHTSECCEEGHGGGGLVVDDGAIAHVAHFDIQHAEAAGLIATAGVTVRLEHGWIHDNFIGTLFDSQLEFGSIPGIIEDDVITVPNDTVTLHTDVTVNAPSAIVVLQ